MMSLIIFCIVAYIGVSAIKIGAALIRAAWNLWILDKREDINE